MSKISKTAAASMRGGQAEKKVDPFDTNEKKIKELRVQRLNRLAVNRFDFIDALIVEYDKRGTDLIEIGKLGKDVAEQIEILANERDTLKGDIQVLRLQLATAQTNTIGAIIDADVEPVMELDGMSPQTLSEILQADLEPLPSEEHTLNAIEITHETGGEG